MSRAGSAAAAGPALAFCETSGASILSPVHIREIGVEGVLLGGGISGRALCGRDLALGWDLDPTTMPVSEGHIDTSVDLNPTCARCADAWRARHVTALTVTA